MNAQTPGRNPWGDLGRELATLRRALGFSQLGFAPLTLYGRSTLANAESGNQRVGREFWLRCDEILQADGRLISRYDAIVEVENYRRRLRPSCSAQDLDDAVGELEYVIQALVGAISLLDSLERVAATLNVTNKRQRWPLRLRLQRAEKGAQSVLTSLRMAVRQSTLGENDASRPSD